MRTSKIVFILILVLLGIGISLIRLQHTSTQNPHSNVVETQE